MKTAVLTIRLDKDLEALLEQASLRTHKTRSDVARDALRRQLRLGRLDSLRQRIMPFAETRGFLTDEDVFDAVS